MKKGSTVLFIDIESDHKHYNKLLDIMQELHDEDYPLELEAEVLFNWYYDKGRTYGAPENCYPPEFEFEVYEIRCNNIDISDLLTDDDIEKLSQQAIEKL